MGACAQVAEALPPAQLVARLFAAYPASGAALLDAVCALAGVAFGFVVMPTGDLLMGRDLQASAGSRVCTSFGGPGACRWVLGRGLPVCVRARGVHKGLSGFAANDQPAGSNLPPER